MKRSRLEEAKERREKAKEERKMFFLELQGLQAAKKSESK